MDTFYKVVALATSVLFFYLTIEMFFMSEAGISDLGLQPSLTTTILAKRVAMFMLGISVLMFAARNLGPSHARQIICIATGTTLFGLAFLGSYELIRGTVNRSILVAIIIESLLWISFAVILLAEKHRTAR